ncbi:MAG: dephospho-CoA kinase [Ginsengibacter sp.]
MKKRREVLIPALSIFTIQFHHHPMLRIGITGGIGSGKSTVAQIFSVLGIPVYDADSAAKRLMSEDERLKEKIIENFGEASYAEGKLDRKYLAAQVFNNDQKTSLLNSIVHPATIRDAEEWIKQQTAPYVIKEAALIFESGSDKMLDKIIGVSSPLELRIERTMHRNNLTREQVLQRISLQMDEDEKLRLCDYVIVNDEHEMLIPQVLQLHEEFLKQSKQTPE